MKIKFCDGRYNLVEAVDKANLGIECVQNDYFHEALKTPNVVMITASNPMWTFGGGIDACFKEEFKWLCDWKQLKGGGMEMEVGDASLGK